MRCAEVVTLSAQVMVSIPDHERLIHVFPTTAGHGTMVVQNQTKRIAEYHLNDHLEYKYKVKRTTPSTNGVIDKINVSCAICEYDIVL